MDYTEKKRERKVGLHRARRVGRREVSRRKAHVKPGVTRARAHHVLSDARKNILARNRRQMTSALRAGSSRAKKESEPPI